MGKFKVLAYLDTHLHPTFVNEDNFHSINNAIDWAKSLGADFIDVYQENEHILQLTISSR